MSTSIVFHLVNLFMISFVATISPDVETHCQKLGTVSEVYLSKLHKLPRNTWPRQARKISKIQRKRQCTPRHATLMDQLELALVQQMYRIWRSLILPLLQKIFMGRPIECIFGSFCCLCGNHLWNSSCHSLPQNFSGSRLWCTTVWPLSQNHKVLSKTFLSYSEKTQTAK